MRLALLGVAVALSACVQILGDDFEISGAGPGPGSGGSGGAGASAAGPGGSGGAPAPQTLTVTLEGDGRVTSTPEGIDCPTTCTADFPLGDTVTLTAEAGDGSVFLGFSDGCTAEPCEVTMDAPQSVGSTFALHGSRRWLEQVSHPGDDYIDDLVLDPDGNVIVSGTVQVVAGTSDFHVAKLSAVDGTTIWEKTFETTGVGENGGNVAVDADGNVYFTGYVSSLGGSDDIEGFPVVGDLFGNVVAMRLAAADGAVEWLHEWGGTAQDRPHGIGVSGDDVFIAGEISSNPATFGGFSLTGSSGDAFLIRVSRADGTVADARFFEGNNDIHDLVVNGGNVLLVGLYRATTTIDTVTLPNSQGMADGLVIMFNGSLDAQWAKTFGDDNDDLAYRAAAHPDGGFVVTGWFQGAVLFASSGSSLVSTDVDAFAVRYSNSGTHLWSFRYGGAGSDTGRGIDVMPTGETILTGYFADTITFGVHDLMATGSGSADIFVTRMSADMAPTHEWAVALGGDTFDVTERSRVDDTGDVYLVGSFSGMTEIDGEAITSMAYDSWVASLVR